MDQKKAAMIAAICGVAVIIGVLLPWWTWSSEVSAALNAMAEVYGGRASVSSGSLNGTQGYNGTFILILGLLGGGAAALIWKGKTQGLPLNPKQLAMTALGGLGLGALLTLIDFARSPSGSTFGGHGGKGIGIYLTLLAALAGTYAAWVLWQKTPAAAAGAPPPAAPPPPAPPPAT